MKSEKAKELIEKYAVGNSRDAAPQMLKKTCILCVELAEYNAYGAFFFYGDAGSVDNFHKISTRSVRPVRTFEI